MDTLRRDLTHSARALSRTPGFTAVVLVILALGIGATTAIFSVVKGVLLDPLPYKDPAQLVQLHEKRPRTGRVRNAVSVPDFVDWKQQSTAFADVAAVTGSAYTVSSEHGAELIQGAEVTSNFFHLLGIEPQIGRSFLPEDAKPGRNQVVILSHGLWQRRFGGDRGILDRTITLTGKPFTVIGVLPPMTHVIAKESEIWEPLVVDPGASRGRHFLNVYGRLKAGVSIEQARVEMDLLASRLEQQYPNENTGHGVNLFSLEEEVTGNVRPALFVLLGAVGLLLTLACVNVANLYLSRAVQRQRELSIRIALGARTATLIRQSLTESLLLSVAGGTAGVGLAYFALQALVAADPGNLPRLENVRVDVQVLLFALAVSVAVGVLFGLAPALSAAKTRIAGALKEGGRSSTGGVARNKTRKVLVIAEIALAFSLIIAAGLMLQSFVRLAKVNPGFDPNNVLTATFALMGPSYAEAPARLAFVRGLEDRMRRLPGVMDVGATSAMPLRGRDSGWNFVIAGRPPLPYSQQPNGRFRVTTPDYFKTLRIPLRSGRLIEQRDSEKAPPVLVVNETLARQYWPDEDAVGKRISLSGETVVFEIVGVVADVKHYSLGGETRAEMYFPYAQMPQIAMTLVVRTAGDPTALASALRKEIANLDKGQPIINVRSLDDLLSTSVAQPRLYSVLLGSFSALALMLAALGIYGVMSFAVRQRTHEIGVRIALGARAGGVRAMIMREGLLLAGLGTGLGIASSLVLARLLEKLLYGITATDTATFAGAALLLVVVALIACFLPARRATLVDPMVALRSE